MKSGFQPRMSGCKEKDRRMIGEEGKILETWIEYFTEMLNEEEDKDDKEDCKMNLIVKTMYQNSYRIYPKYLHDKRLYMLYVYKE
jgi:hypothetical protein